MAFEAGKIVGRLSLDRSKFSAAIKTVQKQTRTLGGWVKKNSGQFRGMGLAITAMGATALLTFKKMLKQYVEVGDMIHKMALRTGFAAETLSELAYAADISGADINSLEKGVKKMSKTIVDAGYGLETYLRVFRSLGLEIDDLMALSPEEQFLKIGSAIAEMENDTLRTAAAVDVFGRSGTMLLPFFKEGAKGIAKLREEAHTLGIIFDEEAAAKAAKLKDAQTALKGSVQGLSIAILNDLIPIITDVTKGFTDWFVNSRKDAATWTEGLLGFFKLIAQGIQGMMLGFHEFQRMVFEGGELIVKALRLQLELWMKTVGLLAKISPLGSNIRKLYGELANTLLALTYIEQGYREEGEKHINTMTNIIVGFEKFFTVLDRVKTKLKEVKQEEKALADVTGNDLTPKAREFYGALDQVQSTLDSYVFGTEKVLTANEKLMESWGLTTEAQLTFSQAAMGEFMAMEASIKGFVDAILGTFEKWALGQIIPKIMAALPFPLNLLATGGAILAIKTIFKAIRGMEEGGWIGLHGEEIVRVGERGPEYISSNDTITNIFGQGDKQGGAKINFNFYAPIISTTGIASSDLDRVSEELFRKMEEEARRKGYSLGGDIR